MELKQIKDLMSAMGRTGMHRLSVKDGKFELELEREVARAEGHATQVALAHAPKGDIPAALHPLTNATQKEQTEQGEDISSPMVGTFYASPSPEDPPFVKVGDQVTADTIVCIVEAMKVMNEVKAGVSGKVTEALVEDGHPVEFGTKLFRIT